MQASSLVELSAFCSEAGKCFSMADVRPCFGYPQQESPKPEIDCCAAGSQASLRALPPRSIRVNELAAHIGSEADARAYVDAVADMFADSLPPSWATRGIRERMHTPNMRPFPIHATDS